LESVISPSIRIFGLSPADTCRSDAPRSIISSSSARRFTGEAVGEDISYVSSASVRSLVDVRLWVLGTGLPHYLLQRRYALQHLQPAIHSQGEHSFLDCHIPDRCSTLALNHHPAQRGTHRHHFVQSLPSLHAEPAAVVAARALEVRQLSYPGIE